MGSWKGRGNQYTEFVRVLYCKLPTNGKQLPAFPLETMTGIEPRPQRWEARVLPLCHHAPPPQKWQKNHCEHDMKFLKQERKTCLDSLTAAKQLYFQNVITQNKTDQRKLFCITNSLLIKITKMPLPSHESTEDLANGLLSFFETKLTKIRDNFDNTCDFSSHDLPFSGESPLDNFYCLFISGVQASRLSVPHPWKPGSVEVLLLATLSPGGGSLSLWNVVHVVRMLLIR